MANNKCSGCGGNLKKIDAKTFVCEHCGTEFTLAELNNASVRQYASSVKNNSKQVISVQKRNSALTDKKFLPQVDDLDLLRQIELALKIKNWVQASRIANEMLRRDPCNAYAYLFKMLAVLQISKKEDLKNLDTPLDKNYRDYYEIYEYYEDYEEEHYDEEDDDEYISYDSVKDLENANYYRLFLEFADENLKQEIDNYINESFQRSKLEEEKRREQERIEEEKRQEQERTERQERWELEKTERQERLRKEKKEKCEIALKKGCKLLAKIIAIAVVIFIIGNVITHIVHVVQTKQDEARIAREEEAIKYSADNLKVEVTNKTNTSGGYYGANYYDVTCKFDMKVTNNSTEKISYFSGTLTAKNANNTQLMSSSVSISTDIGVNTNYIFTLNYYVNYSGTSAELIDTDYDNLNFYFCIETISFYGKGTVTYDENQDVLIKPIKVIPQSEQYQDAMNLYNQEKFADAKEVFEALGDYKDSIGMVDLCNQKILEIKQTEYQKGVTYLNQENYAEAYQAFTNTDGYLDSNEKITQIQSTVENNAMTLVNNGEYTMACEALSGVGVANTFYDACLAASEGKYKKLVNYGITDVVLDVNSNEIKDEAFDGCTKLTSIKITNNITSIGAYAFYGCSSLKQVFIPASVQSIGRAAFNNPSLTIFCSHKERPDTWSSSWASDTWTGTVTNILWNIKEYDERDDAIYYLDNDEQKVLYSITDNQIFNFIIDADTNIISKNTFKDFKNLTSISIPATVKEIQDNAFAGCSSLQQLLFENNSQLEIIGSSAFCGCSQLSAVTIPNTVIKIGSSAFSDTNLTTVTIPSSVEKMGRYAFCYCDSLTTIYCRASAQPSGWNDCWESGYAAIYWGYKE